MTVNLWLKGYLKMYIKGRDNPGEFEVEAGSSVKDFMDSLKIPWWGYQDIYLNDQKSDPEKPLNDGDILRVYPRIFVGG